MTRVTLMVGTQKGAFMLTSDERREQWELSGPMFKGWAVFDLAYDCRTDPTLYAAVNHFVYGPGVHISKDFGKTWEQVEHSPKFAEGSPNKLKNIWFVQPGRASEPEVLYAGVDEAALFISRDRGLHWDELTGLSHHPSREDWCPGNGGLCCHSLALDPRDPGRMAVGISAVGVFRTEDGGATWETSNDGLDIIIEGKTYKDIGTCVHHMVIDPQNPDRLFQQNHRGLFRSLDGGRHWERIENGIPHNFGFPMVVLPHAPDTLFIVPQESDEFRFALNGQVTVYRTTDGGDSWRPLSRGLPANAYIGVLRQAMTADTCEAAGVYFGASTGQIFYSRNAGESWQQMPCVLPRIQSLHVVVEEG